MLTNTERNIVYSNSVLNIVEYPIKEVFSIDTITEFSKNDEGKINVILNLNDSIFNTMNKDFLKQTLEKELNEKQNSLRMLWNNLLLTDTHQENTKGNILVEFPFKQKTDENGIEFLVNLIMNIKEDNHTLFVWIVYSMLYCINKSENFVNNTNSILNTLISNKNGYYNPLSSFLLEKLNPDNYNTITKFDKINNLNRDYIYKEFISFSLSPLDLSVSGKEKDFNRLFNILFIDEFFDMSSKTVEFKSLFEEGLLNSIVETIIFDYINILKAFDSIRNNKEITPFQPNFINGYLLKYGSEFTYGVPNVFDKLSGTLDYMYETESKDINNRFEYALNAFFKFLIFNSIFVIKDLNYVHNFTIVLLNLMGDTSNKLTMGPIEFSLSKKGLLPFINIRKFMSSVKIVNEFQIDNTGKMTDIFKCNGDLSPNMYKPDLNGANRIFVILIELKDLSELILRKEYV